MKPVNEPRTNAYAKCCINLSDFLEFSTFFWQMKEAREAVAARARGSLLHKGICYRGGMQERKKERKREKRVSWHDEATASALSNGEGRDERETPRVRGRSVPSLEQMNFLSRGTNQYRRRRGDRPKVEVGEPPPCRLRLRGISVRTQRNLGFLNVTIREG